MVLTHACTNLKHVDVLLCQASLFENSWDGGNWGYTHVSRLDTLVLRVSSLPTLSGKDAYQRTCLPRIFQ